MVDGYNDRLEALKEENIELKELLAKLEASVDNNEQYNRKNSL